MGTSGGWLSRLVLGVIFLLAVQGVTCEHEPTESECRPYIQKALKEHHVEAEEGSAETVVADTSNSQEENSPTESIEDSNPEGSDGADSEGDSQENANGNTQEETGESADDENKTDEQNETGEQSDADTNEEGANEEVADSKKTDETQEESDENNTQETQEGDTQESIEGDTQEVGDQVEDAASQEGDTAEGSQEGESVEEAEGASQEGDASQETASQEADTKEDDGSQENNTAEQTDGASAEDKTGESNDNTAENADETGESKEGDTQEEGGDSKAEEDTTAEDQSGDTAEVVDEAQESIEGDTNESADTKEDTAEGDGDTKENTKEGDTAEETTEGDTAEDTTEGDTAEETTEGDTAEDTTEGDTAEDTKEGDTAEDTKEGDTAEDTKEGDTAEDTKEGDTAEDTTEGETAEDTKEGDTVEDTKEGETAEDTKEGDTAEDSKEGDTVEDTKEGDTAEDTKEGDTAEDTTEGDTAEETTEGDTAEATTESDTAEETASEAEPEQEVPEEDLTKEREIPTNLRSKAHITQILKLDEGSVEAESALSKTIDTTLHSLKNLYDNAIKPLEILYKYRDLSNRHFGDPEIFSKPLVLFMGPWSGGKSSTINYLLDLEFTDMSLRTGAEPSPAYFNILMHGDEYEVLDGTQLAADWTFSGLQKFGQGLLDRLRGVRAPIRLLEKVNIVEIPGILEIRKQVQRLFPFNDACQWFIDRADIIFLVYDPAKLDVGPETEAILDQLKGREYQTRIILNKADQVKPEELMRVQGTLIWNISPLMSSQEPPVMYTTSLWSMPYEIGAPTRLLLAQERAFLRDLREAIEKRVDNKIASARRFAVRVRNHAKMVDCYLTTYYNHKTFFGNKKKTSDDIIENPTKYHIYEGLSTLTNISRYDLPDPEMYRDFFRINPLYDFVKLSDTCTYFRGCPINKLDVAIAYDLPELVGKYKKAVEAAKSNS